MGKDNKIDVIGIFNSVKLDTNSIEQIRSKMGIAIMDLDCGHHRDEYMSHPTISCNFLPLCVNHNILYRQRGCFHVTEVPCKEADFTYCFYYNKNQEIQWRTHQIGNCPDTEYEFIGKECE